MHEHDTPGGMIGNDSRGVHAVQAQVYGPGARTAEQIEELDVATGAGAPRGPAGP